MALLLSTNSWNIRSAVWVSVATCMLRRLRLCPRTRSFKGGGAYVVVRVACQGPWRWVYLLGMAHCFLHP